MQTQNLQIIPRGIKPIIKASQFDVGREFQLKLYDGAVAYTPPTGTTLRLDGVKPDGNVFSYTENLSLSGSTITVTTTTQMTILEGTVMCEIRMTKDNEDIGTINFDLMVEKSPINETTDLSQTEVPALVTLARTQMENAEAWAVGTKDGEPVSPDDPQYENSAKFWAEHAQRLSGLTDVELTSPADKQSLVYDATEQKWVNGSISASNVNYSNTTSGLTATKVQAAIDEVAAENQTLTNNLSDEVETRAKLGGHNLFKFPTLAEIKALNTSGSWNDNVYSWANVTFTINSDDTITINCDGTGSNTSVYLVLYNRLSAKYYMDDGNYIINGLISSNANKFFLTINATTKNTTSEAWNVKATDLIGAAFTVNNSQIDGIGVSIPVFNDFAVNNVVVKPMIRLASDINTTYQLYAMTNRELTEDVNNLIIPVSLTIDSASISGNSVADIKLNDSTSINVSDKIPSGYKLGAVIFTWSTGHSCIPTQCYVSSANNYRSFALSLYNISSGGITVNSIDVVLICKRA